MAVSYSREELGRGISLTRIYDKKFKSNCVKIAFISPLNEKTACVNAMLQTVLVTSNAEIPSRTKLTSTLTGLYGSSIGTNCGTIGDCRSVCELYRRRLYYRRRSNIRSGGKTAFELSAQTSPC